jgi:hypothetical protein
MEDNDVPGGGRSRVKNCAKRFFKPSTAASTDALAIEVSAAFCSCL